MAEGSWILQIADLHLLDSSRGSLALEQCSRSMARSVACAMPEDAPLIVAVCGDVTSRGGRRGGDLSLAFCLSLAKCMVGRQLQWALCPGNHDIEAAGAGLDPEAFSCFNRIAWQLGQHEMLSSDTTTFLRPLGDMTMVLVNSAYHLDHKLGQVDIDGLAEALGSSDGGRRIVLVHHHVIPMEGDKGAAISNAHEFLQVCLAGRARLILHGHGHAETMMMVGSKRVPIVGTGSLFGEPRTNRNNEFVLLRLEGDRMTKARRYRFIADHIADDGTVGAFVPMTMSFA